MAFFKSFQHNLPSVNISSILDSVSSRVDDLANAVSDVTYAVSDQLTEQVTTIINKVQDEEEGEAGGGMEPGQAAVTQEGRAGGKSMWPISLDAGETASAGGDVAEAAEYVPSQLEWEWRDGCWRVKKSEAELAEEERKKREETERWEEKEQRRKERRQRQQERRAALEKTRGEQEERESEGGDGAERDGHRQGADGGEEPPPPTAADAEGRSSVRKSRGEEAEEEEDGTERSPEQIGDGEKQPELPEKVKKKKSDKKKEKGEKGPKKSGDSVDAEKKKAKEKKSKKKKKKGRQGQMVCCFCSSPSPGALLLLEPSRITILKINLSALLRATISSPLLRPSALLLFFPTLQRVVFAPDKRDV